MTLTQPRSIPNHSQPKNEIDLIQVPTQCAAGISQLHKSDADNASEDVTAATTTEESQDSLESAGKSNLSFILKGRIMSTVNYTGICGSDVHYWEHGAIGHFKVKDPMCLAGRYNLCLDIIFAATPPNDGTLAGFWVAPFDFCYKLPSHVSLQEGALIEPLAVAVHIVKQAQISPGASVVVMGAGPVGLLCAAVARCFGAFKLVSVDILQAKLDFAKIMGSTHTYLSQRIPADENAKALMDQCSLGNGADVVIDASGAEASIQASLYVVKVGGTFVQGGMGKSDITFPITTMCQKEVTARGSFRYGPGDFKLAVEWCRMVVWTYRSSSRAWCLLSKPERLL
ncbi:Endo-1,4-beta-xylanase 2 [Metarhizium acridum]|uniref:Endo-1,4-beta-xylanase 2 n=1 Tax=Metarhizium acridum TaxID=92637 RepID=UPI001C6CA5D7|nr:Endo-1,4-beta-xylanase 2 [Metarhizium acridum]